MRWTKRKSGVVMIIAPLSAMTAFALYSALQDFGAMKVALFFGVAILVFSYVSLAGTLMTDIGDQPEDDK